MKIKNLLKMILFTLLSFVVLKPLFSQCDMIGIPNANYDNLIEAASNIGTNRGSMEPKTCPIHFFVVKKTDGTLPNGFVFSKTNIDIFVNEINSYYAGSNISFVHCKTTYIVNDTLFNLDIGASGYDSDMNPIYLNKLLTGANLDTNSVCIYVVGGYIGGSNAAAFSAWPDQIPGTGNLGIGGTSSYKRPLETNNYVITKEMYAPAVAHELGHYFGLIHTDDPVNDNYASFIANFVDSFPPPPYPDYLRLKPVRLFTHDVTLNGITYKVKDMGDKIEETEVDPGRKMFVSYCTATNGDCKQTPTCTILDPDNYLYTPLLGNLMKGQLNCDSNFLVQKQKDIVYLGLTTFDSRKKLILNTNSECGNTPPFGIGDKGCVEANTPKGLKNHTLNIYDSSRSKSFTKTMFLDTQNDVGLYNLFDIGLEAGNGNARVNIISNTDNWYEGVKTSDLVRMQKHVLLIEPFNNPYQYLSGDVTNDGKVSTADMVETRKLVLYNIDSFSNVHNWRFVPTYFFDPTVCDFTSFNTNPLKAKCYFNIGGDSLSYFLNSQSKTFMDEFTVPLVNTYLRKQSTWNWKAAKSGDVTCSANDTKLIDDTEEKLFLKNLHRCYYTDEYVNFTVKARAEQEVTAWEMGVRLNPDVLEFNALENTNTGTPLDVENFGLKKWNQGQFRALWIDTLLTKINMQNYTELYKLRLKVKQTTCNFDSLFLMSGKVLPTKFYNDTAEIKNVSIILSIDDVNNGNHSQLVKNIYPNPFDKKISIEFELDKEGFAEINLYDNSGRLINNKKEFCNKGINTITFEDNKGYQQGIIHYVITTKEATQRGTILNTKY